MFQRQYYKYQGFTAVYSDEFVIVSMVVYKTYINIKYEATHVLDG